MKARSGYTLPVFAAAAAVAALRHLHQEKLGETVPIDLLEPAQIADIPIEQVAHLSATSALAIARSDPGDNLDLTRHTPVWALVELKDKADGAHLEGEQIVVKGGEGIGKQRHQEGRAAIYRYARRLLQENLQRLLQADERITVTLILPEGCRLAERTSNAAFGVVEGLSLLGTTGISQPLSAPGQLEVYQAELAEKARRFEELVFCIGENGLDFAQKLGINPDQLLKTANWIGPLLVAAGLQQVRAICLFGYHGKLMKLAGGIFHTHHYLADGRLEILTAHCAKMGLPTPILQDVFASGTAEEALKKLRSLDAETGSHWVEGVYGSIATTLNRRAQAYIRTHAAAEVQIRSVLFDRDRNILTASAVSTDVWCNQKLGKG
jgi:cobalt-precorrin-5B (C1)-methyltransferase